MSFLLPNPIHWTQLSILCWKESLGGTPNIRKIKSKLKTKDISVISMPHGCPEASADPENLTKLDVFSLRHDTVHPKVRKPKIKSPDSSFRILLPWHPTESSRGRKKNFYALGCVIFCDLPSNMAPLLWVYKTLLLSASKTYQAPLSIKNLFSLITQVNLLPNSTYQRP